MWFPELTQILRDPEASAAYGWHIGTMVRSGLLSKEQAIVLWEAVVKNIQCREHGRMLNYAQAFYLFHAFNNAFHAGMVKR